MSGTPQVESKDSAGDLRPRILAHMNKDHAHNLEDYLVVYGNAAADLAQNTPQMDALDLTSMTLSFANERGGRTSVRVPLVRRLETYADARSVLVDMAAEAAHKRGFSEYIVNKVPLPKTFPPVMCLTTMLLLWFFSAFPNALERVMRACELDAHVPQTLAYVPQIFRGLMMIHSAEAVLILYPLMRQHRMSTANKVLGLTLCLFNGYFFIGAYKRLVRETASVGKRPERT